MPDSMMVVQTRTSYFPSPEIHDDRLKRPLIHLPVRHGYPGLRHEIPNLLGDVFDALHPVMHEEDLALPQ